MNFKEWLRSKFCSTPKEDIVTLLEKDSEEVVDVFTSTVKELNYLNSVIDSEYEERALEIQQIIMEQDRLSATKEKNLKVINKINSIFED